MCCLTEGLPLHAQNTRCRSGSASIRSSCTAERAEQLGLVNLVVPPDRLLDAARTLPQRITRHAPTAVAACLAAVTSGINVPVKAMAAANETRRSWIKASCSAGPHPRPRCSSPPRRWPPTPGPSPDGCPDSPTALRTPPPTSAPPRPARSEVTLGRRTMSARRGHVRNRRGRRSRSRPGGDRVVDGGGAAARPLRRSLLRLSVQRRCRQPGRWLTTSWDRGAGEDHVGAG